MNEADEVNGGLVCRAIVDYGIDRDVGYAALRWYSHVQSNNSSNTQCRLCRDATRWTTAQLPSYEVA